MRKLFAILAMAVTASANEVTYRSMQSFGNGTPLFDRGLHGEGQIIAFLDTGVDYDSCFFIEPDGRRPPVNSVDLSRRKIVAYDFLYAGDDPTNPLAYDNTTHGTLTAAAAVADRGNPIDHDIDDAIAPAAKMIVQDGGYTGGDLCSQRPGFGCPVNLTPILTQAYQQGARIHSNSWGDLQQFPGQTANYSSSARDVDAFVYSHPDFLVVFNTGNVATGTPPASSLSAPGCAKNTLQVGGTRDQYRMDDDWLSYFSLIGPTRDGRIKPDVVGPAVAWLPDSDGDVRTNNCNTSYRIGTSYSSPAVAGGAALGRPYYTSGFYPTGTARAADAFTPSAALLKATIIAAARPASWVGTPDGGKLATQPVPSYQQGFGYPVLDDALYFAGDTSRTRVSDVATGLAGGESTTIRISASSRAALKMVLVWTDPPGVPRTASDPTPELVNDLDLRVVDAAGQTHFGNETLHPGQADRLNNVEALTFSAPASGVYTVTIAASRISSGSRQNYALVILGDIADAPQTPVRVRAVRH
jgi:hypothetical protein